MSPLTELIIKSGNSDRILSAGQLQRLLGGSSARRYGLVNRALKSGELIQLQRGLYLLSNAYRSTPAHPYALAQQMVPGSYVSAETALGFHGWIPEIVHSVLSVTARGKSVDYEHETLGKFEFRRMTVASGYWLRGVARHELQQQVALIAEPVRALLDLVYLRKLPWQGLEYLLEGLRIDEQALRDQPSRQIIQLLDVYKGRREQRFIRQLSRALET